MNREFDKKKMCLKLVYIICCLLTLMVTKLIFRESLSIEEYQKEITIEVNSSYEASSPSVCYGSILNCKEIKPVVETDLDITTLGTYTEKYLYKYASGKEEIITKTIVVSDTEKPVITANEDIKMCPNGKVLSTNYSATDNYDGDLTAKLELINEDDKYYLVVADSSNNEAKQEVSVVVEDTEKPVLTLNKGNLTIYLNNKYTEYGAEVTDNCDDDLKDKIKITGEVNTGEVGTYNITYEITDSSGNKSTATRTIKVKEYTKPKENSISVGDKVVYLTFDDGPGPYTLKLLSILEKYNAKATFFVTNQFGSATYLSYLKNISAGGHSIGIHSYSHKYSIYTSSETYFDDFYKMNDVIKNYTGIETKLVRFPGGSSNTISKNYCKGIMKELASELTEKGYIYFDWNLSSGDAGETTSSKKVAKNVINGMSNGSVVLLHDIHSYTVNAMDEILSYGVNNGFTFKGLDESSPTAHHSINN